MQIRLTVLAAPGTTGARARDVLVTAPAGTPLASVANALAATVAGSAASSASVVLYAGGERLDSGRCALGEPPLTDGAVLSLHAPPEPGLHPGVAPETDEPAVARLHVVSGPDAGGVHLLHGGEIRIGRSAEADVPLDDPDVSRLHCTVALHEDGRVTVADLGSTNGTTLDGEPVGERPERLLPGALVRLGESVLRLEPAPAAAGERDGAGPIPRTLAVVADGEGHLRIERGGPGAEASPPADDAGSGDGGSGDGGRAADAGGEAAVSAPEADAPPEPRRGRGLGAWARRLTGGRAETDDDAEPSAAAAAAEAAALLERRPDPASVLLTALGPGRRLWERDADHPDALVVRVGTAHRSTGLPSPVTVGLRQVGSLGLAGPRPRLMGLARWVVTQLAALHAPSTLELVLIDASRPEGDEERRAAWSWLGWLPQVRPAHGQDCRLLLAHDRDQAAARVAELVRRLDDGPLGPGWSGAGRSAVAEAAAGHTGPYSVVIVDGDPGSRALRETLARIAANGASAGIHLICLAETPPATPASPVTATLERARTASPAFAECGAVAMLSGDVATALRVLMPWSGAGFPGRKSGGPGAPPGRGTVVDNGVVASVDAVSAAWAERLARALAPLRVPASGAAGTPDVSRRVTTALPRRARLLDELGLARATPASLTARWAAAADASSAAGGAGGVALHAVLGAGPHGPLGFDLVADGPHLVVEGGPGTGKTELLRAIAASLAAGDRPDRVSLVLVDGSGAGAAATVPEPRSASRGEGADGGGLRPCTDLPHTLTHLTSTDPVRMREFAQELTGELKRRARLLGDAAPAARTASAAETTARIVAPRRAADDAPGAVRTARGSAAGSLPRLVVLVDDFDALVSPALGSTGRPAAGSVVRALEAVARDGARLGVHLVVATGHPERTAGTAPVQNAGLRVRLELLPDEDEPLPSGSGAWAPAEAGSRAGRGLLIRGDGRSTPFQAGRVTGRIPRTSTLRPTVVPLDWERAGDPPDRRPLRELGNGPTDLALLASAMQRAASSAGAEAPAGSRQFR